MLRKRLARKPEWNSQKKPPVAKKWRRISHDSTKVMETGHLAVRVAEDARFLLGTARGIDLVGVAGFEPATPCSRSRCCIVSN